MFFPSSPILCFRTVVNQAFVVQEFFLLLLRIEFFLPVFPQSRKREKERGKVSNIIRDPYQARQPPLRKREREISCFLNLLFIPQFLPPRLCSHSLAFVVGVVVALALLPLRQHGWRRKSRRLPSYYANTLFPLFRVEIHTSLFFLLSAVPGC